MSIFTQLTIPTTLTDLLKARNDALRLVGDARRTLNKAEELLEVHGRYLFPYAAHLQGDDNQIRRELDRRMWSRAFDLTGFKQLMDAKAVKEFEDSLEKVVPEFTEGTIRSTFLELYHEPPARCSAAECSTCSATSPQTTEPTRRNLSGWDGRSSPTW